MDFLFLLSSFGKTYSEASSIGLRPHLSQSSEAAETGRRTVAEQAFRQGEAVPVHRGRRQERPEQEEGEELRYTE